MLSIEEVCRKRRKIKECAVEAHPGVHRVVRGIKQRNKQRIKQEKKNRQKQEEQQSEDSACRRKSG
jgi:hypothetical protein